MCALQMESPGVVVGLVVAMAATAARMAGDAAVARDMRPEGGMPNGIAPRMQPRRLRQTAIWRC